MDNHFFYFSKGERIGIIVLITLCVVLFILPGFLPDRSQHDPVDFSSFVEEVSKRGNAPVSDKENAIAQTNGAALSPHTFDPNQATKEDLQALGVSAGSIRSWLSYIRKGGAFKSWQDVEKFRALSEQERSALKPYLAFGNETDAAAQQDAPPTAAPIMQIFNPNDVSKNTLQTMGISEKVAHNWTRFIASGGRFRKPEEIQKVYGLSTTDFERLLPYVELPETANDAFASADDTPRTYEDVSTKVVVDINQASAAEWQELRGIGPAFSKRIVNFRDKLGGFQSVQQVSETYGLPDSVFQKISLQLRPSPILRKLKINTATVEELATHPYLRFSDARMIVSYREEHGAYAATADLDKLYGLEEQTKQKIKPYLSFE
ncbi:MAG: helix-hairpin-helix domain-containing protein [Lewinella sp.]|jgi:competence ComEA-like helix-hairpin-helix protein|uniref:helix-hairpin-helix domain-containing protein n=1 Tax=Lewinella sp. TaxID=2004506 RepID=UPI003D6C61D3